MINVMIDRSGKKGATSKVLKAMSLFSGTQMVQIVCGMVRNKFVSVLAGQAGIGLLAIYSTVVEMMGALVTNGIRTSAVREFASRHNHLRAMALTDRASLFMGVLLTLLMIAFSPLLSYITFHTFSQWLPFVVLSPVLLFTSYSVSSQAIFQGTGRLKMLAGGLMWSASLGLALSLPLLFFFRLESIEWLVVSYALVGAGVFAVVRVRGGLNIVSEIPASPSPDFRQLLSGSGTMFRLGGYLAASSLMVWGAGYLFMSWLNNYAGSDEVGIYQCGYTMTVKYLGLVFTAIAMEFYPRLSSVRESTLRSKLYVRHELSLVLKISFPVAALFACCSPLVIRLLYNSDFLGALPYLLAAIPATMLRAVGWCLGIVILTRGNGRIYMITEGVSAAVMLIGSITGYICAGVQGLGLAYMLQYIIYTPVVWYICHRYYNITPSRRQLFMVVGSFIFLSALCIVLTKLYC